MSRLAEIKDREAAAKPGPWGWEANTHTHSIRLRNIRSDTILDFVRWGMNGAQPRLNIDGVMREMVPLMQTPQPHNAWRKVAPDHPDAAFIANSREDVPWLIRRVEALEEAHEKYESLVLDLLGRDPDIDKDEVESKKKWVSEVRALLAKEDQEKVFP